MGHFLLWFTRASHISWLSKTRRMEDLIIIEEFLDSSQLDALLQQLERQGLSAFQEYQLPGVVNGGTGRTAQVLVPGSVVQAAKGVLGISSEESHWVTLPALMSRGDVRSHRDVWHKGPGSAVNSHTVIIWLQGGESQLILEGSDQQHVVDARPGRLVAFDNQCFHHAVQGTDAVRAMVGPMALERSGRFRAVMDVSVSSDRGWCGNCLCCCFLCCALPVLLLCEAVVGSGLFLLLLAVRAVLGTLHGALVASVLTPILALCYAGTALYWSPCIFFRACKGLRGEFRSMCLVTLLLLPLRAPVVLVLSLVLIFLLTFLWIVFATLIYEEETEECKNLLLGGLIAVGPFTGVLQFLPKITMDWWRYHSTWSPELSIFPQRVSAGDPVEPQWFGADLDSQLGRTPAAFMDQSEMWQYVAGSISTKDILSLEPFLFVGLPAAAVVRLVLHSLHSEGLDFVEVQVTAANRPHNAFADSIWSMAMKAKREADRAKPISDLEKEYLTVTALQRPDESGSKSTWESIEAARQAELSKIVAAAVDLSLTASRSKDFKASIGSVIQGILETPQPKEGWA
eukprot:s411_g14.t1